MKLHRTSGKPDWETVDRSKQNGFQKVAAATSGMVTAANGITLVGLGLVIAGLMVVMQQHYLLAAGLFLTGRLLDVFDGIVADVTGTKGPLGEALDAAVDKLGTILALITLFVAGVAAWWIIAGLLLPQLLTAIVIFYKRQRNIAVHPTRSGKLSMALLWVGLIGLLLVRQAPNSVFFVIVTGAAIGLSLALGFYALWQYVTGRD